MLRFNKNLSKSLYILYLSCFISSVLLLTSNVVSAEENDNTVQEDITNKTVEIIKPVSEILPLKSEDKISKNDATSANPDEPTTNDNILTVKLNKQIELAYAFLEDFKINLDDPDTGNDTQINPDNYVALYLESGLIIIHLLPDIAPNTTTQFRKLVRSGFYNNLLFYHVIPNYILQAGDPTNSGYGGFGKLRPAEINNNMHFLRGSVGISNLGNLQSDDSQFFISYNSFDWLDGKYTLFGEIVAGMALLETYTPQFSKEGVLINPLIIDKMVVLSDLPKFRPKEKQLVETYSKEGPLVTTDDSATTPQTENDQKEEEIKEQ